MSEYRKGRVLVLVGMLGFSTISVLAGTAGADPGTIKVKAVTNGAVSTSNGNEPMVDSGCVNIATDGFATSSAPQFTAVAPTADATLNVKQSGDWWSVTGSGSAGPQGYHVRVTLDGKTKVFWVSASAAGCAGDPPADPGTGPAVF